MTVYKIGCDKIKITLTHSEVLSYFGNYESIAVPTAETKLAMNMLLKESLTETGFDGDGRLLVEVKARESAGCIIMITSADKNGRQRIKPIRRTLEFSDSESMILGVVCLYRRFRRLDSSLYKMAKSYRLIINVNSDCDFFFMNEFCIRQSDSAGDAAYTEEHGRLLVRNSAVERLGSVFSKSL